VIGGLALLAVVVVVIIMLVAGGDDDDDVTTDGTTVPAEPDGTTTTETPTTTEAESTTTEVPPTTFDPSVFNTAVWPQVGSDLRYDDPVDAARGFAVDFVGFEDPVLGEFMAGDSRSGEVEVRPLEDGPVTTVLVRQLGPDDTWWVLGSVTENIEVDEPAALSGVDSPAILAGRARAFEGTVNVRIHVDGEDEPRVESFVTGSGGEDLGPFQEELAWPVPQGGWGAVVFLTVGGEDPQVWEATVVRVGFIGGD
jgi:hypothetical protein